MERGLADVQRCSAAEAVAAAAGSLEHAAAHGGGARGGPLALRRLGSAHGNVVLCDADALRVAAANSFEPLEPVLQLGNVGEEVPVERGKEREDRRKSNF